MTSAATAQPPECGSLHGLFRMKSARARAHAKKAIEGFAKAFSPFNFHMEAMLCLAGHCSCLFFSPRKLGEAFFLMGLGGKG